MVRLTDHPDMTLDVYRGRKTTMQHVARPGIKPRTPDLRVRCSTDCAVRPGTQCCKLLCSGKLILGYSTPKTRRHVDFRARRQYLWAGRGALLKQPSWSTVYIWVGADHIWPVPLGNLSSFFFFFFMFTEFFRGIGPFLGGLDQDKSLS